MLVYGECECFVIHSCMFVSCVHPVAVLNAAFCMTCSSVRMAGMPHKMENGAPIAGGGKVRHNLHSSSSQL